MASLLNPLGGALFQKDTAEPMYTSEFEHAHGYGWDYVMVFPTLAEDSADEFADEGDGGGLELSGAVGGGDDGGDGGGDGGDDDDDDDDDGSGLGKRRGKKLTWKVMVQKLANQGVETYRFHSIQKDEVYVKVRVPLAVLEKRADAYNYPLKLDPERLKATLAAGLPAAKIAPITIHELPELYGATEHVYGQYDTDASLQPLYLATVASAIHAQKAHPFSSVHRVRLLERVIADRKDGCGVNVKRALLRGDVLAAFPLHDAGFAGELAEKWISWNPLAMPWSQDCDLFREYFGEKLALYMAYLCHYTAWLLPMALIGVGLSAWQWAAWSADIFGAFIFAIVVTLWLVLFQEYWKARQCTHALTWGMSDFEAEESDRPGFKGELIGSFVDGAEMFYFSDADRRPRYYKSIAVTGAMFMLVLAFIIAIQFMKGSDTAWVATIATYVNSVGIAVLNKVYQHEAMKMTENENHRTDTEHSDALISKLFLFQFVNSYSSLYVLVFLQKLIMPNVAYQYGNVMSDLCVTLLIIFVTNLVSKNIFSSVVPKVQAYMNFRDQGGETAENGMSAPELQFLMLPFDGELEVLLAYNDLVIQLGYVSLFVVAFPGAPVLAFVSNWITIRMDCNKYLFLYRRASPTGAQDIGTWQAILKTMAIAAVITNAAIVCFKMDYNGFYDRSYAFKQGVFIVFTYSLFMVMTLIDFLLPDEPAKVTIQRQRMDFINDKLIKLVADEDDSIEKVTRECSLIVKDVDDGPYFKSIEESFKV